MKERIRVSNWSDLDGLESENYKIEVDKEGDCGCIRGKKDRHDRLYLSTHFFCKTNNINDKSMEKLLLERYGFDLEIILN